MLPNTEGYSKIWIPLGPIKSIFPNTLDESKILIPWGPFPSILSHTLGQSKICANRKSDIQQGGGEKCIRLLDTRDSDPF